MSAYAYREASSLPLAHYGRLLGVDGFKAHDTVILIGREQLPPLAAERLARAVWGDDPDTVLALTGEYGFATRRFDTRDGSAHAAKVHVHADPRIQAILELHREHAMGQALDRLRLIHPDGDKRVLVASNVPIPGLIVDRVVSPDEMLEGGTPIERALSAMAGGVLPLVPAWLAKRLPGIFPSLRTAEREVGKLIPPNGNRLYIYCRLAELRIARQTRWYRALVREAVTDPRAELARLLGAEVIEFRWADCAQPAPQSAANPPAAHPDQAPSARSSAIPERYPPVTSSTSEAAPMNMENPIPVAPLVEGGSGDPLALGAALPRSDAPGSTEGRWSIRAPGLAVSVRTVSSEGSEGVLVTWSRHPRRNPLSVPALPWDWTTCKPLEVVMTAGVRTLH